MNSRQTIHAGLSRATRFALAKKAFTHTAAYDGAISNYLTALVEGEPGGKMERSLFPNRLNMQFTKVQDMRYGENPHQSAAFYRDLVPAEGSIAHYQQLQGKELSFNNIGDADAAWEAVKTFDAPACVIVKHANPCGVAVADTPLAAYRLAFATDSTSAFGGIIAFNCEVDQETVEAVTGQFLEVLIAPSFSAPAKALIAAKKNVRVLEVPLKTRANRFELKRVGGGLLIQSPDVRNVQQSELTVVTSRAPSEQEMADMLFAWRVAKYVKSNAIVFAKNGQTAGIGAGQMSRVDSTRIAARKAEDAGLGLKGAAAASDAFFPFRDGVDVIAAQGITAIIQPGGSVRDPEVIAAANEHGIAMGALGRSGAVTVALVNQDASPLAACCDWVVPLCAGQEKSIAATKSYIASLSAVARLIAHWQGDPALLAALRSLPDRLQQATCQDWSMAVDTLVNADRIMVVGRGLGFAIALEAALKFKETCALQAEAFSSAEIKHGPMELIDEGYPLLIFAPRSPEQDGLIALAREMRERGARVLLAAPGNIADRDLTLTTADDEVLDPLLAIQSFYLMAARLSEARGLNPDQPRYLAKITRTV